MPVAGKSSRFIAVSTAKARSDKMDTIFIGKIELETNRCRSGSFSQEMILI
jgi:hypothetical protein